MVKIKHRECPFCREKFPIHRISGKQYLIELDDNWNYKIHDCENRINNYFVPVKCEHCGKFVYKIKDKDGYYELLKTITRTLKDDTDRFVKHKYHGGE